MVLRAMLRRARNKRRARKTAVERYAKIAATRNNCYSALDSEEGETDPPPSIPLASAAAVVGTGRRR